MRGVAKEAKNPNFAGVAFDWEYTTGKTLRLPNPPRQFIPDFLICDDFDGGENPYLVVEVSWSQSFKNVQEKVDQYFEFKTLGVAIIINIEEKLPYHQPKADQVHVISRSQWPTKKTRLAASLDDPIIVGGHTWIHETRCTFYIFMRRGEADSDSPGILVYEEVQLIFHETSEGKLMHRTGHPPCSYLY